MNRRNFENLFVPLSDLEKKERKIFFAGPSFRPPTFGGWGQQYRTRTLNSVRQQAAAEELALFQVQSLRRFQREQASMNLTHDCIFNIES